VIRRLGLRSRLTLLVTVVFASALVLTSLIVVNLVEDDLVEGTREGAERVLATYLDSIYGGTATVGVLDATDSARFFYLDENGQEITEKQYFEALAAGFSDDFLLFDNFAELDVGGEGTGPGGSVEPFGDLALLPIDVDPLTGELLDHEGEPLTFAVGPLPVGEPRSVDLGRDVVGVAQALRFDDGSTFEVGVSNPLRPVTDSLDAIRRLLWFAVPGLVLAVAAITWIATSRALSPVHSITSRAREISAANMDERLPVGDGNDEIQELARTMNEMLGRLAGSQLRQRQLVADASHELRSPVAASRAQLEVAQANPAATDWSATAATVLAEQEHLSRLIDDLLALSKIDESGPVILVDVDLDDLVDAEARRPHRVPVRTDLPEPVRASADFGLLTRAVRNLVENAVRHAKTDVVVSLRREDRWVVIEVDDDGPGVPPDDRERVFDRFSRLDEARDRGAGGTGLGLAIVEGVAHVHGGTVSVSESDLGGARFSLTLPAEPSQDS